MTLAPESGSLFEKVVSECGLSAVFANTSVRNALARAGVENAEALTVSDLRRALPELQTTLSGFLDDTETAAAMGRLQRLAVRGV